MTDLADPQRNGHPGNPRPGEPVEPPGSPFWRALGVLAALAIIAFWIYVFANRGSIPHPDEFDDAAFSAAAEAVCAPHQQAIADLPLATAADDPIERGVLVKAATGHLSDMLSDLRALPSPTDDKAARSFPLWLGDYETYLNDRVVWTAQLEQGLDEPFLISGNADGERITDLLNTYSEVNNMRSCAPSLDA